MPFEIKNFKCFPKLRLEQVGDLNLIAEKNNVGKTTVLEAVAIFASEADPSGLFRVVDEREAPTSEAELVGGFKSMIGDDCAFSRESRAVMIEIPARQVVGNRASKVLSVDFQKDPNSKLAPTFSIAVGLFPDAFDLTVESRTAAYGGREKPLRSGRLRQPYLCRQRRMAPASTCR